VGRYPPYRPPSQEGALAVKVTLSRSLVYSSRVAKKRIGELLIERGAIDDRQLTSALSFQREQGGRIGQALVTKGFLTEEQLVAALGEELALPVIDIPNQVDAEALKLLKAHFCETHDAFPLHVDSAPAGGRRTLTLVLAALCPFTAAYAVAPLTETPTLFAIALALWALARFHAQPTWGSALAFTFAVSFAALLRPDGALVGVALVPALVPTFVLGLRQSQIARSRLLRMAVACTVIALLPFAIWAARNWRVFHVFEPLAPRYATDPGESTNPGWQRWMKTWCLDYVSTYDIYWNVPGSAFDLSKLPSRAFDSPAEYAETAGLAAAYNDNGQDLSPEMDARFAQLAAERIRSHPMRYYVWLPLGRMADMWLRPRVENLNIDLDWWVYSHHYSETRFSWGYAALNAAYLFLALVGLCFKPRYWAWMLLYLAMRSALLMTIEAPEARYTLECFPIVFVLAGIGIDGSLRKLGVDAVRSISPRIPPAAQ